MKSIIRYAFLLIVAAAVLICSGESEARDTRKCIKMCGDRQSTGSGYQACVSRCR